MPPLEMAPAVQRRYDFSNNLLAEAMTPRPIASHTAGIAQLGRSLIGGLERRRADQDRQSRMDAYNDTISRALEAYLGDDGALASDPTAQALGSALAGTRPGQNFGYNQGDVVSQPLAETALAFDDQGHHEQQSHVRQHSGDDGPGTEHGDGSLRY